MLRVKNIIAATTTCEIDKSSFKSNLWAKECTVNVTFSYKDFSSVLDQRDKFLGAADFNMLLAEVEDTVDFDVTLEFTKDDDGHYLLANGLDLVDVYDYDLPELEFMNNIFDTISDSYIRLNTVCFLEHPAVEQNTRFLTLTGLRHDYRYLI